MRLGAHVSIRGHIQQAVDRARAIGCECLQIFVGSPRRWDVPSYPPEDLAAFRAKRTAAGLHPLVAHTCYLVNLAATGELHEKSVRALTHALRVMESLDGLGAVTHIGGRTQEPFGRVVRRVARAVRDALRRTHRARVLLEGSAGSSLGGTFGELRAFLDALDGDGRVGVCLDTAHLFASGWDLRTEAGVEAMLGAFDAEIGLDRLHLVHLNDTPSGCGSRVDRHENIGEGAIGLVGFRALVTHPKLRPLAGIIETPGFDRRGPDRRNLRILKALREGKL